MTAARAARILAEDTRRVEMVATPTGHHTYRVQSADGWCEFMRTAGGFTVTATDGRDPIADQSTDRFLGLPHERSALFPRAADNAYPYAYDQIAQLFDHPSAPDVLVVRSAAFHVHGNLGEHGNLGAVQSRAAFVASGAGIRRDGIVDRHLRAIDVAPTMAAALGCLPDAEGRHLRGQDGTADQSLLTGDRAGHVIAFLFDGLNANLLLDAVAAGDVPNIARLVQEGACYRQGSLASLPTVTLPNHATLLTGAHPGHHGILSNTWFDRETGTAPDLLDVPQMVRAAEHLSAGVETMFEVVRRSRPDAFTAATYEYADRGADWSTYGVVRAGERPTGVPHRTDPVAHASEGWFEVNPSYHFMSRIDHASTAQARALLSPAADHPTPTFLWVTYNLTDEAGHHAGPHGDEARDALRDTDARLGDVLAAAHDAGLGDDLAVFVLSDHGMEQTDPEVGGHYRPLLDTSGIDYADLDDGLVYLH